MGGIGAWGAWGLGRRARSASVQPACKRTKTGQDDRLALPHATPRHATATPPLGYLDTSSNILPKAMPSKLNLEISTRPFSPVLRQLQAKRHAVNIIPLSVFTN
ncbi:hypothetical protein X797_005805 [Metarhizium robertsii]|uniref:Uncharacterized protein n=1 Tax=Metarhizium robertsii TaxID=568076 RepID=A0A014PSH6_9HYPO|nr:hypothetical protein X797_005805 [Metarhizium robertsii]